MLKKTIAAEIIPSGRICKKCGQTVSISPTEDKTYCDKCGELVYENTKSASGDSETESGDSVEFVSDEKDS